MISIYSASFFLMMKRPIQILLARNKRKPFGPLNRDYTGLQSEIVGQLVKEV
jgi:hypothetical protein